MHCNVKPMPGIFCKSFRVDRKEPQCDHLLRGLKVFHSGLTVSGPVFLNYQFIFISNHGDMRINYVFSVTKMC
jgi:hypothetical protein